MVDLVIKNCKIVNPWGTFAAGLAVQDGKIITIGKDDSLPESQKTIDAAGNYVIPGLIDTHVHLGPPASLQETASIDTVGAAVGGVTTIGNFMGGRAWFGTGSYAERFEQWKEIYEKYAVVDVFCHMFVVLDLHLKELIDNAKRYGMPSCKFHMGYREVEPGNVKWENADDGFLYRGFQDVASLGSPARAMVHAENINIINRIRPVIEASGRQDLAAWTDSRPTCSEVLAIEKAIHIAKVTETPLYITHISTADSVDVIARAKAEGVDVIAETCPQYLILTKYSNLGPLGKTNPPLRDKESNERLWRGINDNTVECMGTDHSTHKRKAKQDIWTALPGISGMEYFLSLMLSEGVNKGRLTLEKLVEICCYNNARIFGIYPRKGTISVGSDADLVIIDLNKSGTLSVNTSHQLSDFCAYEGWEVKGLPLLTMIRGNVVAENGKLIARSGIGRYIHRPMH